MSRTRIGEEPPSLASAPRSDGELVQECLNGNEEAWSELLDKYKNLIYSVPIKYHFSREEAADVFQEVCFELLSHLKNIREPQALAKWLLMVTSHKCFHLKRRGQRMVAMDEEQMEQAAEELPPEALEAVAEAEQEQELREVIASLSERCRQLVKFLFFEEPARPYQEVARSLGVAIGSIGFMRQRCLESLRKKIESRRRL